MRGPGCRSVSIQPRRIAETNFLTARHADRKAALVLTGPAMCGIAPAMSRRTILFLVTVSIFAQTGCGTTLSIVGPSMHCRMPSSVTYSGVRLDAEIIWAGLTESPTEGPPLCQRFIFLIVFVADLPLSAIADTVLSPLTIYGDIMRAKRARALQSATPPQPPPVPASPPHAAPIPAPQPTPNPASAAAANP